MNMANILDNQEISQALAEGLMELSKDNSVSVFLKNINFKNPTLNTFLVCSYLCVCMCVGGTPLEAQFP